jgi:hypothetical protein
VRACRPRCASGGGARARYEREPIASSLADRRCSRAGSLDDAESDEADAAGRAAVAAQRAAAAAAALASASSPEAARFAAAAAADAAALVSASSPDAPSALSLGSLTMGSWDEAGSSGGWGGGEGGMATGPGGRRWLTAPRDVFHVSRGAMRSIGSMMVVTPLGGLWEGQAARGGGQAARGGGQAARGRRAGARAWGSCGTVRLRAARSLRASVV